MDPFGALPPYYDSFQVHEHGMCFHVFKSPLISFSQLNIEKEQSSLSSPMEEQCSADEPDALPLRDRSQTRETP